MEGLAEDFIPKKGDIIRLPMGCGAVLDIFTNDKGDVVLKVLFAKNVVKLQDPEFLPLDMAYALGVQLSDEAGLSRDIDDNQRWYETQYLKRLSLLKPFLHDDIPF